MFSQYFTLSRMVKKYVNIKFRFGQGNESASAYLEFINKYSDVKAIKIEDLSSCVHYITLMNKMEPGAINTETMKTERVANAMERQRAWRSNWKLLQKCFNERQVDSPIDLIVEEASRGKITDNLHFVQWFKPFYLRNTREDDPNAPKRIRSKRTFNT